MSASVGNDSVWRSLLTRIHGLDRMHVKVGVLSNETHENTDLGNVEIAAIHEFGSPAAGIPERSFIRRTFANAPWMPEFTTKLVKQIVAGRMDLRQALEILGLKGVTEVKRTIIDEHVEPRLEESAAGQRTIARKGSSVTLVETSQLVNSLSHQIVDGKPEGGV